jgi:hypothetical protein
MTVEFRELSLGELRKQFSVKGEELLSAKCSAVFGYAGGDPAVIEPNDLGSKIALRKSILDALARLEFCSRPEPNEKPYLSIFVICKPSPPAPQH